MKYQSRETIEAIGFQELVEIGLATEGANIVNGVPWSFQYQGWQFTHETDDLYLFNIAGETVKFRRGDFLVTDVTGALWIMSAETIADNYTPVEAPRVVDADIDDNPRIPESWSREDVARELRAARRRCSEIQTENRRIKLELGTATRLAARETIRAHDAEEALAKSRDAYLNMRDFAEANGLNTATTGEDEDPDGNVYVVTPDSDLGTIKKALEQ